MIKRQMYGRAGFSLLRKRVILHPALPGSQNSRQSPFFAQDHATSDMVYSNADITKAEQAREIIAFADYWQQDTGSDPA
jgi:hypothetical protein